MNSSKYLSLFVFGLAILGAGCSTTSATKSEPQTIGQVMTNQPNVIQQKLPANWERRKVSYPNNREVTWVIIPLDKKTSAWTLVNNPSNPKSVRAWRNDLKSNLVINGSYFDENYLPAGFYQSLDTQGSKAWPDKQSQKDPNSYSGLIKIKDKAISITYLAETQQEKPAKDEQAFLSYPTLVAHGKALVKEDSGKFARRTILAKDGNDKIYIIITENGLASLYEAAQWLAAQPEKFSVAVNLDGGPSTGISYSLNDMEFNLPSASVPNVLSVNIE